MSTKTTTTTTLLCDLPPHELARERPAVRTIRFSIDGKDYEADLCVGHLRRIARNVKPFIDAARMVKPPKPPKPPGRSAADRRRTAAIRAWAVERELVTKDRGRIPAWVVAEYEAEHGTGAR